jgi:beta-hydroxylase
MFFFKWYGRNVESTVDIPEFRADFRYVRTIGVSMFRGQESTSRHFGPFRPTLRVLYCLNKITDPNSFIKVGYSENRWRDNRLFIFDDTLLHQSFNNADTERYVLFVDILRPSYLNFVFDLAVTMIRLIFKSFNGIFYKNWKLVNN